MGECLEFDYLWVMLRDRLIVCGGMVVLVVVVVFCSLFEAVWFSQFAAVLTYELEIVRPLDPEGDEARNSKKYKMCMTFIKSAVG